MIASSRATAADTQFPAGKNPVKRSKKKRIQKEKKIQYFPFRNTPIIKKKGQKKNLVPAVRSTKTQDDTVKPSQNPVKIVKTQSKPIQTQ